MLPLALRKIKLTAVIPVCQSEVHTAQGAFQEAWINLKFDPAFELYSEGGWICRKYMCIIIGFLFFSSQKHWKKNIIIIKILWSEFNFKCFMPLSHLNVFCLLFYFIFFSLKTIFTISLPSHWNIKNISAILLKVQSHIFSSFLYFYFLYKIVKTH